MVTDSSEDIAGSLLSSVLELSALVMSLNGADVALVGPLRRFVLYLHKTVQSIRVLSHAPILSVLDVCVGHGNCVMWLTYGSMECNNDV